MTSRLAAVDRSRPLGRHRPSKNSLAVPVRSIWAKGDEIVYDLPIRHGVHAGTVRQRRGEAARDGGGCDIDRDGVVAVAILPPTSIMFCQLFVPLPASALAKMMSAEVVLRGRFKHSVRRVIVSPVRAHRNTVARHQWCGAIDGKAARKAGMERFRYGNALCWYSAQSD